MEFLSMGLKVRTGACLQWQFPLKDDIDVLRCPFAIDRLLLKLSILYTRLPLEK